MRVTYKLTAVLLLGMSVVLAVDAFVQVRREVALFEFDMRRDASLMGRTLAGVVQQVWRSKGEERLVELLEEASLDAADLNLRWVWLDAPAGSPQGPRVPLPADIRDHTPARSVVHASRHEGSLYTYVTVALPDERRPCAIEVRESLALEAEYLRATLMYVGVATGSIFAVSAALAVIAGLRFVGRPMQQLVGMARRVGQGDLAARTGLTQRDEIGELAGEMDAMAERLGAAFEQIERETAGRIAALEQLRHADRLATVGQLASGLAHELGTPLNVVSGRARLIASRELGPDEVVENAEIVVEQSARMTAIIRQLLDFARRRGAQKEALDLRDPARRTQDLLSKLAERAGVTVEIEAPGEVLAEGDPTQLQQVLTNLLVNAIQAMPGGGRARVVLSPAAPATPPGGGAPRPMVRVAVEDEGQGISPEDLPRVFEPFFTTKPVGDGTGLGLSVAHGIVGEHGGWIAVESRPGQGSAFTVFLPPAAAQEAT